MASKKKRDGCTSARCVRAAIQMCGCTDAVFFAHNAPVEFHLANELEKFRLFETKGISAVPMGYKIPKHVLEFAEEVHKSKNPRSFFRKPRAPVRAYSEERFA